MEMLTISQAAKKIGVHPNRLREWEKQGLIKPVRLPSNQRRYPIEEIERILGTGGITKAKDTAVIYARVSTKKQAESGNLVKQIERLRKYAGTNGFVLVEECSDVASGLNQKRRGLDKVLKLAEQGHFKKLIIEYPDRLARFGYAYLERHLKYCGVEIVSIGENESGGNENELVRDLLAIVTSFSARLYGARGGKKIREGFRELISSVQKED
jgi:predicted site-specific integrase-resolvase